jgi:hypothetical protein
MIHFEGVNTWDVNIYLYYWMNVTTNLSLSLCGHYSKESGRSCRMHIFISKGYNVILLFFALRQ